NGLYRTFTARPEIAAYAGRVKELLTIDELHRRMGHIGHSIARDMVKGGMVTGIELDEDSKPSICQSCEWGKGTRKAITRERVGPRAEEIGGEIHSDLWGPAPVKTIGGREYFTSFTD
ncbi:hypothetical protein B0H34DRAFT_635930, partial [Crassisporium funariophilum]